MIPVLLLSLAALAAEDSGSLDLPPAPERTRPVPVSQPEDPPDFGADFSVGFGGGALLGPWPTAGVHGLVLGRYDAFIQSRAVPGPRLGLGIWASGTAWPLQQADEDGTLVDIKYLHYGVMSVLRFDPSAPLAGAMGLGFGRLDLNDYWGGPLALPTLSFELGLRQALSGPAFLDWMLRAHWGTARSGVESDLWEEWWMVGFSLSAGAHLR